MNMGTSTQKITFHVLLTWELTMGNKNIVNDLEANNAKQKYSTSLNQGIKRNLKQTLKAHVILMVTYIIRCKSNTWMHQVVETGIYRDMEYQVI